MNRRTRIAIGTAGGGWAVAAAVAAVAVHERDGSPRPVRDSETTQAVRRTTLRDRLTLPGTLGFPTGAPIAYRMMSGDSGTHTVTWVAPVGSIVGRGDVLFRVDQQPVRLMFGSIPSYRPLRLGVVGRDVAQLQRNLAHLGYGRVTVDGRFGWGTSRAVRRWQKATGVTQTGMVDVGAIAFAAGPRRIGEAITRSGAVAVDGAVIVRGGPALQRIEVRLPVANRRVARVGSAVVITLPDQSTTNGTITAVGTVAAAGSGETGPTVAVTVRPDHRPHGARLDRAPVSVAFTRAVRTGVLAVPVEALQGAVGGGFVVRVVRPGVRPSVRVPVTPGLIVDGLAEIRGASIAQGDKVVVPDAA